MFLVLIGSCFTVFMFQALHSWNKQNGKHLVCDVHGKFASLSSFFLVFHGAMGLIGYGGLVVSKA